MKLISNNFVQSLDADFDMNTMLAQLKARLNIQDPFFICKLPEIVERYMSWRKILPRVTPFYAVNGNSSCIIMETLAALDVGFECTNKKNIIEAVKAGSKHSMLLSSAIKTASILKLAAESGVSIVSFDKEYELDRLKKNYPEANLLLHVKTSHDPERSFEFGSNPLTECKQLAKRAQAMGLNVVGLYFNIVPTPGAYAEVIALAKRMFEEARDIGINLSILNLGSGFPTASLNETAEEINMALERHFPGNEIEVMGNGANYFVESAYILSCQIEVVREVEKKDEVTGATYMHREYYINDGVFGSFQSMLTNREQKFSMKPLNEYPEANTVSSSVWGPSGTEGDRIIPEISLPEMKVGDTVIFDNMGLDTSSNSSNGYPVQKVFLLADDNVWNKMCQNQEKPKELYFVMGNQKPIANNATIIPDGYFDDIDFSQPGMVINLPGSDNRFKGWCCRKFL